MRFISMEEYLMGRDKTYPLDDEQIGNANTIVPKANLLLAHFGEYRAVTSGYRPAAINKNVKGAAKKSNHILCAAIDLEDKDGKLNKFCKANPKLLEELGLWCEERQGGWQHLQIFPPKSKKRWFYP